MCPEGSVYHLYHEDYCEVSDDGVVALVQGCPQLEIIDITACCYLTAVSIAAIAACCPLLKGIDIRAKILLHGGDITAFVQGCPQLTSIRLDFCQDGGDIQSGAVDEGITVLAQCCPMLHTIDLAGSTQVTDVGIEAIALGCPLLKTMYLNGCSIWVEGVNALIRCCPHLTYLSLNNRIRTLMVNGTHCGMARRSCYI